MKAIFRKTFSICLFLAVMFMIVGTAAAEEDVHNCKTLGYVQDNGITKSGMYDSGVHYDSSTHVPLIYVHDFINYEQ